MLVYAVHEGGRYVRVEDSLKEQPQGKRGIYVNITNRCNCSCSFCLRTMKHMAEESSLWLKQACSLPTQYPLSFSSLLTGPQYCAGWQCVP